MKYLQEHWEMLSTFTVMIFGLGGLHNRISNIEMIQQDIQEIKEFMAKIEERTKNL